MKVKPVLNAFLICDQVLRDQHGRCSLVGIFQHLKSPAFPLPPRSFSVFISLSEVLVPARLELLFKEAGTGRLIQKLDIACETPVAPSQPYEISADFANVAFEAPGTWDFELRADGAILAIRTLQLSHLGGAA